MKSAKMAELMKALEIWVLNQILFYLMGITNYLVFYYKMKIRGSCLLALHTIQLLVFFPSFPCYHEVFLNPLLQESLFFVLG